MAVRIINADTARSLLCYEPATGEFTWRESRGRVAAGQKAGSIASNGYWEIYVENRRYRAHRLAWFMVHGGWPADTIDHRNGDKLDNRIANLREATTSQNHANQPARRSSRSGFRGVHFSQREQRWVAKITCNGRKRHIGQFISKADAIAAYARVSKEVFGEFARSAS